MRYPVNDIYTAIQGEGVQTGIPMILLRLHGCAVGCPWCDTKETWDFLPQLEQPALPDALGTNGRFAYASAPEIAAFIQTRHPGPRWVLITGGEPAQYPLQPLVAALHSTGYKTALETSGTESGHLDANLDWICVSPKINMPGGKIILPAAIATADEIKHAVGKQKDIVQLDALLAASPPKPKAEICLQPISQSAKATKLCMDTVAARGWRLSVQMHKYLQIR